MGVDQEQMGEQTQTNTVYLGNLDPVKTTRRLLYEIGIQAGPVASVSLPTEGAGRNKGFGFLEYESVDSAAYAVGLFKGNLRLFDRAVRVDFSGQKSGGGGGAPGSVGRGGSMGRTPSAAAADGSSIAQQHTMPAQQPEQQQQLGRTAQPGDAVACRDRQQHSQQAQQEYHHMQQQVFSDMAMQQQGGTGLEAQQPPQQQPPPQQQQLLWGQQMAAPQGQHYPSPGFPGGTLLYHHQQQQPQPQPQPRW